MVCIGPLKTVTIIEWDATNIAHFLEHGRCSRRQVEDILFSRCHPSRMRLAKYVGEEARYRFYGQTCAGRYLVVIATLVRAGVFRPITCWPLAGRQRTSYLAWRRARAPR